jgi:hypothetical protein
MKMLRSRVSPNCENIQSPAAEGQIQITTGAIQIGFLDFNCDYNRIFQPLFS